MIQNTKRSPMTEEEIRKDILERIKKFPTIVVEGREMIVIDDKKFPKQWFIEHCVRMKKNGEI